MADITILLADNDRDFLTNGREFLEANGYRTLEATSPQEAKNFLKTSRVHLAILDMRMENDSDEKDKSGLNLAKTTARSVPKLILTRFPAYQDVVEALKQDPHALPPAVDFLDKRKSLDDLLASVEQVLTKYVLINWDLIIHWETVLSFSRLIDLIDPELDKARLADRTAEFEDLWRTLFRQYAQITMVDLLAHGPGYVVLSVFAYDNDGLETQHIVSCGQKELIRAEMANYQTAVSGQSATAEIVSDNVAETVHFAANAYRLVHGKLEELVNLKMFFHRHSPHETMDAIERLYKESLGIWYETGRYDNREQTVRAFYQGWLKRNPPNPSESELQQCIEALCAKTLSAGLGRIEYSAHFLTFHLPTNGFAAKYPNPIACLHDKRAVGQDFVQWGRTHGRINLETALLDENGSAYLLDFTQAGQAPLLHDFVSLETAVKLHLPTTPHLHNRYTIEQSLSTLSDLNENLDGDAFPNPPGHIINAVIRIRQLAAELTGCEYNAYLSGLFFHAVKHLFTYQPDLYYTRQALGAYIHALVTTAVICQKLGGEPLKQDNLPNQAYEGLWIDKINQDVWVKGVQIDLTAQDFQILVYLYDHAGELCQRETIIKQGLGDENQEYDRFQEESRLNSAMSRLRQKIEPNSQNPQYLITVRGRGYKLMPQIQT
ncbi:MAG: DNA-binding response regulator [Chloroflexi bacterium]|nr:DNA-binding response regulator [Chloroflexota bacterium]